MAEVCVNLSKSNGSSLNTDENLIMYKKEAVDVVRFKFVYDEEDLKLKDVASFRPQMAHQIFGETESIFGYRSLSINLYYLHNSANCYVDIQKSGMIGKSADDVYKPDDILEIMSPWLPDNFVTNRDEFIDKIKQEEHDKVYGEVLEEFKCTQKSLTFSNVYPSYLITVCEDLNEEMRDFHRRFETLIIWFIDAANFIDLDDKRWMIFYVYEKIHNPNLNKTSLSPVGFCTVYKFFSYPNKIRTRISQFFIVPTHQKRKLGTRLYQAVVEKIRSMDQVVDITVEEPTFTFQRIRDLIDSQAVLKVIMDNDSSIKESDQKRIFEIAKQLKICKKQSQRVYDVLKGYEAMKYGISVYCAYTESIKTRITSEIERQVGSKRICLLENREVPEAFDKYATISLEYRKYLDSVEPSVKYLESKLKTYLPDRD